ncbi:dual specificity protein kinase kns1, partial [Coelomomyces lativittatus]
MPTSSALSTSSSSSSSSLVSVSCSAKLEDKDGHYVVTKNDVIAGTYTVIRQLGQGTFGKVAECEDQHTGQRVAIKLIRAIQKYKDASLGEIRVLKTLKQADPMGKYRCIQLLQEFTYRQHQCMVFPLLGPSLFDFLRDNQFQPFSLPQVFTLASQVLQAVAFLHRLSIVHTDLKPENIVLVHGDFEVTSPPFTHHIHVSKRHESDLVK